MGKKHADLREPQRVPPAEAPADAVERVLPRRFLLESGDVVITRERVPQVNPRPMSSEPQWRFRVRIHPESHGSPVFTSFSHAASHAEQLAADRCARVMFVDDEVPSLLVDYRKGRTT